MRFEFKVPALPAKRPSANDLIKAHIITQEEYDSLPPDKKLYLNYPYLVIQIATNQFSLQQVLDLRKDQFYLFKEEIRNFLLSQGVEIKKIFSFNPHQCLNLASSCIRRLISEDEILLETALEFTMRARSAITNNFIRRLMLAHGYSYHQITQLNAIQQSNLRSRYVKELLHNKQKKLEEILQSNYLITEPTTNMNLGLFSPRPPLINNLTWIIPNYRF